MTLTVLSDPLTGESQAGIQHVSELRFRASSSSLEMAKMDPSCSKSCIKTNFKELQDTVFHHLSKSEPESNALIKLKKKYQNKIGGKRAFDRIGNFESLFSILKKRDELSYNKLEPFKFASDIIGDKDLKDKISKFEDKFQGIEFRDLYENGEFSSFKENRLEGAFLENESTENERLLSRKNNLRDEEKYSLLNEIELKKLSEDSELRLFEGEKIIRGSRRKKSNFKPCVIIICTVILVFFIFSGILLYSSILLRFTAVTVANSSRVTNRPNMRGYQPHNLTKEAEIGKKVLNYISERIGIRWRDMARHLDIREFDIDALDEKHPKDLKEKAYQALIIAQAESDPRRWKSNLMRALVEARRKDLSDWIDETYNED